MTEELQKYRSVLLDRGTSAESRRSETITIQVDGEELPVEIRALPMGEFQGAYVPDELVEKVGQATARDLVLLTRCTYIPGTDQRVFRPPIGEGNSGDVEQLLDTQYDARGFVTRINEVIVYVHGFTPEPPNGVQDPRLESIAEAADRLKSVAKGDEDMSADKVAEIADMIAAYARDMDRGGHKGK